MADRRRMAKLLALISQAWTTPDDDDYCVFFPWIPGDLPEGVKRGTQWHESDAFRWPADREAIIDHMVAHEGDDLFWTPLLYDGDRRVKEMVAENRCLFADLDEADPHKFEELHDLKPTIAWETSPGRYQALWILEGDIVGATDEGAENHRLTYLLGADRGGWDATQVLRIPTWVNHKAEYRTEHGEAGVRGRLLWRNGPIYLVDGFDDLPEVLTREHMEDVLDADISAVNWREVYDRVKLKLPRQIRDWLFVKEEQPEGTRSDVLWQMERSLADAGCTAAEIVALVRRTGWNKYAGRGDELLRLKTEAARAVSEVPEATKDTLDEERDIPLPKSIEEETNEVPDPTWLVKDIWQEGSCGFIGGEPKSFKTWLALDLAYSVAMGIPFLGKYPVTKQGRVLLIEEEDSRRSIRERRKFLSAKHPGIHPEGMMQKVGDEMVWSEPVESGVDLFCQQGIDLSVGGWQTWLKDAVAERGYVMVIIDPFNMVVGDTEIERHEVVPKVLAPLKLYIAAQHECAIVMVHHMKKSGDKNARGGSRLLGSTALHGWTQESMYVFNGNGSTLRVDRESKNAGFMRFEMIPHLAGHRWEPEVVERADESEHVESAGDETQAKGSTAREGKVEKFLRDNADEEFSTSELAKLLGITPGGVSKQTKRLVDEGKIVKTDSGKWSWK